MNIYFIGTVEFSYNALETILNINGANVVGVATKEKSNYNADYKDLTPLCKEYNVPYHFLENINEPENITYIQSLKADIIFCFGWSNLLKKDILECTPMGVVGYHPAALPFNRGRHPLIWAIVLGLKQSASTFFFMDEGADSGDILSQSYFDIKYDEYAFDVYQKMNEIAQEQIKVFVPQLISGNYPKEKQDHSIANLWRKRGMRDGRIDFRMSSISIYNLVRGLSKPYVGASVWIGEEEVKIWKSKEEKLDLPNIEAGKVLAVEGNEVLVKTNDGGIWLTEHEFKEIPKVGTYL